MEDDLFDYLKYSRLFFIVIVFRDLLHVASSNDPEISPQYLKVHSPNLSCHSIARRQSSFSPVLLFSNPFLFL
jgi:hypothetical protein